MAFGNRAFGINYDFMLEVAKGNVTGHAFVNRYGRSPDGIQTTATDVWDRADATPTQQIWLAPTAARIHAIVSSSASDDGSPVGVGARTIRVYGLTSWSAAEVSEDITLNGTGSVNTVNAYVSINKMKVLTSGSTSINVGTITATAATDSTVTAVIRAGKGQNLSAIYSIPSIQTAYLDSFQASLNDATAGSRADMAIVVNENPDAQTTNYITTSSFEISNQGSSFVNKVFNGRLKIPGPAIIKIQGIANAADEDISAGFDLILVNN